MSKNEIKSKNNSRVIKSLLSLNQIISAFCGTIFDIKQPVRTDVQPFRDPLNGISARLMLTLYVFIDFPALDSG